MIFDAHRRWRKFQMISANDHASAGAILNRDNLPVYRDPP
jgi:hypothetical protein